MYKTNKQINEESLLNIDNENENKKDTDINKNDVKKDKTFQKNKKDKSKFKSDTIEPSVDPETAKQNKKIVDYNKDKDEDLGIMVENVKNVNTNRKPKQNKNYQNNKPNTNKPYENYNKRKNVIKETPVFAKNDKNKTIIAKNENNFVYIPTKHRKANLCIIGLNSSGKSSTVLPMLINQDLLNKDIGTTLFVSGDDIVYKICALAKHYGRNVVLIKPSANIEVLNKLLWEEEYSYEKIKQVVDFEDAILNKKIVIVDMEEYKYQNYAKRATNFLLMQYSIEMFNVLENNSKRRKPFPMNYIYIDDSEKYIKPVTRILEYGKEANVAVTICIKNRDLLIKNNHDYRPDIESLVRNYIIMNGISLNDAKYCAEKYNYELNTIFARKDGEIYYEILDELNSLAVGKGQIYRIDEELFKKVDLSSKTIKKKSQNHIEKISKIANKTSKTKKHISNDIPNDKSNDIFSHISDSKEPYSMYEENYEEEKKTVQDVFSEEIEGEFDETLENLENIDINENIEENIETPLDKLQSDEIELLKNINQKYESIEEVIVSQKTKEEIMADIINNKNYLSKDDVDFFDED